MPAFTVTAVDTTANTLTATGVAAVGQPDGTVLLTGDRLRLRNVGGALPAATPALVGATDYWAVRVSDDAIKLSDSNAHALAGTNIVDLTGSGSGTTTIEFGLPYSLPTATAAAGTQIKSVNDRAAWASLVALYDLFTGQTQSLWSTIVVAVTVTFGALVTFAAGAAAAANQDFAVSGTGKYKHGTRTLNIPLSPQFAGGTPAGLAVAVGSSQWIGVDLPGGITVTALKVKLQDASGTTLQANLMAGDPNAGFSLVFAGPTSAGTGSVQSLTGTNSSTPVQLTTTDTYYVKTSVLTGVGSGTLLSVAIEHDVR